MEEICQRLLHTNESSPVNQKIATKTIGKLGFQVTAAWNGKEALEYVLGASEGRNIKPDIILMDVQMPIIDGYKCTHLMRHHRPYKGLIQDVPIVAMTASAIQGDREKCTRAGMDDYLAKPVTMGILEKMLIRWCLARRRVKSRPEKAMSDCSGVSEHCDDAGIPQMSVDDTATLMDENAVERLTPRPLVTNGSEEEASPFESVSIVDTAQVRRPEGEKEFSNRLQETKLIDAAGGNVSNLHTNSFQKQGSGEALTEENVNKLEVENEQPQ